MLTDWPAPLTRTSEHLQFFDNYLTETRLLLRQIRNPRTKIRMRQFVQQSVIENRTARTVVELNEREYETLRVFEANELRYNRYLLKLDNDETLMVDMFLNRELWHLLIGTIEFDDEQAARDFQLPFDAREITQDKLFFGANLVDANLEEIKRKLAADEHG